jgi:hypothetical protein
MDLEVRRKLVIGCSTRDDVDQASCPGIGISGAKTRDLSVNPWSSIEVCCGRGELDPRTRSASRPPSG